MALKAPWRYEAGMIAQPRFTLLLAFLCALAVAGCAQSTSSADIAPAAQPAAAQPAASPPPAAPAPQGPMTPEKAKADCWMKYENDKKVKNIDARLTLVEKCVDDTMRGALVTRPER
jgi:hypothetical protein